MSSKPSFNFNQGDFRFPIKMGEHGNPAMPSHLACPGRPGGWITTIHERDNIFIVEAAVNRFGAVLPDDKTYSYLTNMHVKLDGFFDCKVFYKSIYFEKSHNNSIGPGLWLTARLYVPPIGHSVNDFQEEVTKHIEFFVCGSYTVQWKPSQNKGESETPFFDTFELTKFGYVNKQNKKTEIVFEPSFS